jgi:lysophospholipase L1-like esterase
LSAEYFADQSKVLNPDLIVIALGTNEALDHPYSDPKFLEYVNTLFQKLKSQNPNALFLISIPSDSFKKKTKKNPGVTDIRKKLLDFVELNKIACFDLYEAGGGKNSAEKWRKAELLRDDGVHFTKAGYELQGNMFYLALMNAYNQYVSNRLK